MRFDHPIHSVEKERGIRKQKKQKQQGRGRRRNIRGGRERGGTHKPAQIRAFVSLLSCGGSGGRQIQLDWVESIVYMLILSNEQTADNTERKREE